MRVHCIRAATSRVLWCLLLAVGLLPPATAAAQSPAQEIILRVDTPVYQWDETGLHVRGYATLDQPGAPALPMWSSAVELPASGHWRISFEAKDPVTLPLDQPLPPVPTPQIDLNSPQPWQNRSDLPQ